MRKLVVSYTENGKYRQFEIDPRDKNKLRTYIDEAIDINSSSLRVTEVKNNGGSKNYTYDDWSATW